MGFLEISNKVAVFEIPPRGFLGLHVLPGRWEATLGMGRRTGFRTPREGPLLVRPAPAPLPCPPPFSSPAVRALLEPQLEGTARIILPQTGPPLWGAGPLASAVSVGGAAVMGSKESQSQLSSAFRGAAPSVPYGNVEQQADTLSGQRNFSQGLVAL